MDKIEKPVHKKSDGRKNNGGKRDGSGRKPVKPTDAERKQVEALSGYGVPFDQIGALFRDGIEVTTLRKYFGNELLKGKAKANSKIGQGLYQKAIGGDTTAMIWWSKCQMGWKETKVTENTGNSTAEALAEIMEMLD